MQQYLDPAVLAGISSLDLLARTVVDGFVAGLHRSPDFAFSHEFAEYRAYVPGDDLRHVDWNLYARTERTYLKRFRGETNSQVTVLLDASRSMEYTSAVGKGGPPKKMDYARFVAASLFYLAIRKQRDAAGLIVFDDEVRDYVRPSTRQGQIARLFAGLEAAEPRARTNFAKPMKHFQELLRRRGIAIVISDFYEDPASIVRTIEPLRFAGNEVVLFHVLDPQEIKPVMSGPAILVDLETDQKIEVIPEYAKTTYRAKMAAHLEELESRTRAAGMDYQLLVTDQPLDKALREYLTLRGESLMGFLAPWFLGGLAALGVPVFVHLLRRHVTTPRPVGSLMFFERGTQSSTRHRRLRHWLLFLLRFALVLFLVLAFANPFVRRSAASANGRLMLIVVDNSFSMQAGTRFAQAKQEALALVASKPGSQRAQVMALGGQLGVLTQATADAAQLREAILSIEQGDGRANYGELGRGVRRLGETVREPIDVHLFSDMQRSAMPGNFAEMGMGERATLVLHPVADRGSAANWTVESVDAPGQLADIKDPKRSRVRAVVAGYGTPAVQQTVDLLVNGKVTATRKVTVPANGRGTVEFAPLDVGYGFNRCEVRVEGGDAFPGDDGYVFAVRRSDPEKVLFVHPAGETRSALYFGAALGAAAQASFVLQPVAAEQTADLDPGKFAFVVLSDAETLPTLFERALEQYVAKGGSVLLALGTGAGHRGRLPLWPGAVGEVHDYARAGGAASVGEVDFTHPAMLDAQPGRDNGGWAGTKVFYASPVDAAGARVAARLSDGTPLVMDRQVGEGHVMLLATGFDNLTNDLPLHPVFVAFVDRTARYLSGDERLSGSRVVDAYVPLRAEGEPVGEMASVQVAGPAGSRPLSLSEARTARTLKLDKAGFYQIHLANGRDAVIGVNPDRRESDLAAMPEDVQRLWSGSASSGAGDGAVSSAAESKTQPVSLWWWVMLLAVVVALAESVVATGYMGTQREDA